MHRCIVCTITANIKQQSTSIVFCCNASLMCSL